jgi:hypothetical protein
MDSPDSQRRQREECERKARRGEMDPRLEFTFQLLMDATGLNRNRILDFIFEGNMVMYLIFEMIFLIFALLPPLVVTHLFQYLTSMLKGIDFPYV